MPHIGIEAIVSITVLGLSSGFAYYLWDVGMKHGNIQVLGALSYIRPLASTLALTLFAKTEPSAVVIVSALRVALGSMLGSTRPFSSEGAATNGIAWENSPIAIGRLMRFHCRIQI